MANIPQDDQNQVAANMEDSVIEGKPLRAMKLWLKLRSTGCTVQPIVRLQLARTLGSVGKLCEAITLCSQLLNSTDSNVALKAKVLLAVYWHRLGDDQQAINLLSSIDHTQLDERYKVWWFSHLLSGFVGINDSQRVKKHLRSYQSIFSGALKERMQRENEIWNELMPLTLPSHSRKVNLDDKVEEILSKMKSMGQPATEPHVYYRIGCAYENFGNPEKADYHYRNSKDKANQTASLLPWLKSTICQIRLKKASRRPNKKHDPECLELAEKAIYFGLKLGVIYIDCPLSEQLLDIAKYFTLEEMVISPKLIPPIHFLRGDKFQIWCRELLRSCPKEILHESEPVIEILYDDAPCIDLIAKIHNTKGELTYSIAIQCKGGATRWTTKSMARTISDGPSCKDTFKKYKVTKCLWIIASGTPDANDAELVRAAQVAYKWSTDSDISLGVIGSQHLTGFLYNNNNLEELSEKLMLS